MLSNRYKSYLLGQLILWRLQLYNDNGYYLSMWKRSKFCDPGCEGLRQAWWVHAYARHLNPNVCMACTQTFTVGVDFRLSRVYGF